METREIRNLVRSPVYKPVTGGLVFESMTTIRESRCCVLFILVFQSLVGLIVRSMHTGVLIGITSSLRI